MNSIKECFDVILTGDEKKSRSAARCISTVTYSSKSNDKYVDIKNIIENADKIYASLKEPWRQENFVRSISIIYFLRTDDEALDEHFPWLFYLLQDSNGHIRHAAVRMLRHDLGPLTVHIRHPEYCEDEHAKWDVDQSNNILMKMFVGLAMLLEKTWNQKYEKYKFVSDLPSSPYKSIQLVVATLEDYCGPEYIKQLEEYL